MTSIETKKNYKVHIFVLSIIFVISFFILKIESFSLAFKITPVIIFCFIYLLKSWTLDISRLGIIHSRAGMKKYIHKDDIQSIELKKNIGITYLKVTLHNNKSHFFYGWVIEERKLNDMYRERR